jgi:ABC-type phosphate transport system permease subunit
MSHDPRADALAIWLVEQQTSRLAQHQKPGELHLHQHHHAAPAPAPVTDPDPQTVRLHPIFVATYILFLSIAISVPLALLAAIVDATNRPSVQYVRPSQGGW